MPPPRPPLDPPLVLTTASAANEKCEYNKLAKLQMDIVLRHDSN